MGDRANIAIQADGSRVYFYTHWRGSEVPELVRVGLAKDAGRWEDGPYLARIIFDALTDGDKSTTGFGISAGPGDNEYPIFVVNCDKQHVTAEGVTGGLSSERLSGDAAVIPFKDYVALKKATWATVDPAAKG